MAEDTSSLTKLGTKVTDYAFEAPAASMLETFANQATDRDYLIELIHPEFTSLCPVTGQPDFATITVRYVPDELCVESKSFKLYMVAYRNQGSFMETLTNKILDDLCEACQPKWMQVFGDFNPRGGTTICVTAETGPMPALGLHAREE